MRFLAVIGLLLASPVYAQLQLDGGASTLYGPTAGGVGVTMYLPQQTFYAGMAYIGDHFILGGSERFSFHGYGVIAGSQSIGYSSDLGSLNATCVCISAKKAFKKSVLSVFVGATGNGFFLPWAAGSIPSHIGFGILEEYHPTADWTLSTLDAVTGGSKTATQTASYRYQNIFNATVGGGILNNSGFFEGRAGLRSHGLSLSVNHSSYLEPRRAAGDNASAGYHYKILTFGGGINKSLSLGVSNVGENLNAGLNFTRVSISSGWYRSHNQKMLSQNLTEHINQRLDLTENIQTNNGATSLSVGGSWRGKRTQVSVNHNVQFLLNGSGYQQTTSISVSVRIKDISITGQTLTDVSTGQTRWTGSAEDFVQANLPATIGRSTGGGTGKYAITGICSELTKKGKLAMQGCAIQIGKKHPSFVFSNSHGRFELHTSNKKSVPITVLVDEFTASGQYVVLEAPSEATPGVEIQIVVKAQ